ARSVDDQARGANLCLLVYQRRVQLVALHKVFDDLDLTVRLHPGGQRPENLARIVDVDVLVEDKDVLGMVEGQHGRRRATGVAFYRLLHGDEDVEVRVAASLADRLDSGDGLSRPPQV